MTLQAALKFIQCVGSDPLLQRQIEGLDNQSELSDLIQLGAQQGLQFTMTDLQAAHKHHWNMRWLRYNSQSISPDALPDSSS